jgi:hypothetical protein
MTHSRTLRGFELVEHPNYPPDGTESRLVQESSIVGDYEDALDRPGTSALWVGDHHHLNREEVAELVSRLQSWLSTGSLQCLISEMPEPGTGETCNEPSDNQPFASVVESGEVNR